MSFLKFNKKYVATIIISCTIVLVVYILYRIKKEDFLHHQLKKIVAEKTHQLYKIKYDSISVNEAGGNLFIKNLYIKGDTLRQLEMIKRGDTNAVALLLDIYVPVLEVENFKTAAALLSKQLECKQITISNAKVTCYLYPGLKTQTDAKKQQQELYKQILGKFDLIRALNVSLINSEVVAADFYTKEVKFHTYNTSVSLTDVAIDSTYNEDTSRIFFCKEIGIKASKVILGDKKKTAEVISAAFDTRSKIVSFEKFEYSDTKNNVSFKTKLEGISLKGISWTGPVEDSKLVINNASFNNGELETFTKNSSDKKEQEKTNSYILNGWISTFSLGSLQLKSLKYISRNKDSKEDPFELNNSSFTVKNIKIDRSSKLDESLINKAENIVLSNDKISIISSDRMYEYRLTGLKLNSSNKTVFIKTAYIIPRYSEPAFAKKAHSQTDRFDVKFHNIQCKGVNIAKLVKGEIDIKDVITNNNSLKIFLDLSYPEDTTSFFGPQKVFLHQIIHKINFNIKINRFLATKTYIEYKEKNAKTDSSGRVAFHNTSLTINNISNHSEKSGETTTVVFASTFLNKIPVTGGFTFFISDWKKGRFKVSAIINKSFDATIANKLTIPMSLVRVEKGTIDFLRFKMSADTSSAQINLELPYHDMKISFLKKDKKEYKNKAILSFLTNIIIRNTNKPGSESSTVDISVHHKKYTPFFGFIWQSLFTGIKDIAILKP